MKETPDGRRVIVNQYDIQYIAGNGNVVTETYYGSAVTVGQGAAHFVDREGVGTAAMLIIPLDRIVKITVTPRG